MPTKPQKLIHNWVKQHVNSILNPPHYTIQTLLQSAIQLNPLTTLTISGWVKSIRQNKFIALNDGSTLTNLQLIAPPELSDPTKKIKFNSYLTVQGHLILTPHHHQNCELKITQITTLNPPHQDYPLQKQKLPLPLIRTHPHLRPKTSYFLALFRLRHFLSYSIHNFFHQENFYQVPTPLITSNDTEGAGEQFNLITPEPFFSTTAKLTVSGQLHLEALAQGLGKVYTFAPCFRAEKSHTTRHLAEFWMIEAELVAEDLETVIKLTGKLIKFVISSVLNHQTTELNHLANYSQKPLISKLEKVLAHEFSQLEYTEAIKLLKEKFPQTKWGLDLTSEQEKYLCHHFDQQPLFITNYPANLKAFYMKNNSDGQTVANFDLIFPEIGELVGGSLRESDYQTLLKKAQHQNINTQNLTWYLDLRRSGYAPSGGFGLGLERLLMFLGGIENIQDTLAFPVLHKHLGF